MRLDTKEKRLQARDAEIQSLKTNKGATIQNVYNLIIARFTFENRKYGNVFCVKVYRGTSYHPIAYYSYRTEEQREKSIEGYIAAAERNITHKDQARQKRQEFVPTLKADDILYSSWGYDQTNVDFYQVLSVKGRTAIVQEIGLKMVEGTDGHMCCNVMPAIGQFKGSPMKRRICQGDNIKANDHIRAYKWDGSEKYSSWYA